MIVSDLSAPQSSWTWAEEQRATRAVAAFVDQVLAFDIAPVPDRKILAREPAPVAVLAIIASRPAVQINAGSTASSRDARAAPLW